MNLFYDSIKFVIKFIYLIFQVHNNFSFYTLKIQNLV